MASFSSLTSLHSNTSISNRLRSNLITGNNVNPKQLDQIIVEMKSIKISPILGITETSILNEYLKEYLYIKNIKLSSFDSFCWPAILKGLSTLAIPNTYVVNSDWSKRNFISKEYLDTNASLDKDTCLSYLCPLISKLMEQLESVQMKKLKKLEKYGFIDETVSRATNGPILIIVCGSCRNAQRIYELVDDIIDKAHRAQVKDPKTNLKYLKKLRSILVQGGGYEDDYDIPLVNGCDILIAATPFVLLRLLGLKKTNLERVEHFVFDEANHLIERFYKQMSVLMKCYRDVLNLYSEKMIAQFIVFASTWSNQLKRFLEKYLPKSPMCFISDNKLESAYYGQCRHVVQELNENDEKLKLTTCTKALHKCSKLNKNTIIFAASDECVNKIKDLLVKELSYRPEFVNVITDQTSQLKINEIEKKWDTHHLSDLSLFAQKGYMTNLVLICTDNSARFMHINNAQSIIHYDFPG
jgi:superfamily II DNA/RNA helicase